LLSGFRAMAMVNKPRFGHVAPKALVVRSRGRSAMVDQTLCRRARLGTFRERRFSRTPRVKCLSVWCVKPVRITLTAASRSPRGGWLRTFPEIRRPIPEARDPLPLLRQKKAPGGFPIWCASRITK
jgi:hypothetical protein